jgi:hypothetical protein
VVLSKQKPGLIHMPLTYDVVDDILVIHTGGTWGFPALKKTLHTAVKSLGRRRRLNGVLLDDRNAKFTGFRDNFAEMARFHHRLSDRIGKKMAVLVSDDLQYGMARMSSAIHSLHGIDLEPFKDEEKAWAWINARK